jgi:hypothetical protein
MPYRPDNSQFTEEQRTEAFRMEVMHQLHKQTEHLSKIRGYAGFIVFIVCLNILLGIVLALAAAGLG